jgi:hypothetical protein
MGCGVERSAGPRLQPLENPLSTSAGDMRDSGQSLLPVVAICSTEVVSFGQSKVGWKVEAIAGPNALNEALEDAADGPPATGRKYLSSYPAPPPHPGPLFAAVTARKPTRHDAAQIRRCKRHPLVSTVIGRLPMGIMWLSTHCLGPSIMIRSVPARGRRTRRERAATSDRVQSLSIWLPAAEHPAAMPLTCRPQPATLDDFALIRSIVSSF